MLKIAVVEDQQEVRDELCRFIRQYAAENSLQVEVLPVEDGAVIAEHYEPGYDIIFMDVEMPGLDGFGAAEKIRAVDADAVLVFVTNMAQYAIKGYEVDALDYVLKPVNYYQFCTKLSRAVQRVQRRRQPAHQRCDEESAHRQNGGQHRPAAKLPLRRLGKLCAQAFFQRGDGFAHQHNGVRQPSRVAKNGIQHKATQNGPANQHGNSFVYCTVLTTRRVFWCIQSAASSTKPPAAGAHQE